MHQLITTASNMKMTSREIAELTEKRHDSVKRTIETLTGNGVIQSPQIVNFKNSNNVEGQEYIFTGEQGKRDSIIVVAQLSPEFTARLVDRWQELETKIAAPQTPEMQIANAVLLASRMIEEQKMQIEQRDKLIAVVAPKAAIADRLIISDGRYNLTHAAKIMGIPPRKFNNELQQMGWIYRMGVKGAWTGTAPKIKAGYLEHKIHQFEHSDGTPDTSPQVFVTAKGMHKLAQVYQLQEEVYGEAA